MANDESVIEILHKELLKEIMIRVAASPNGATDTYNTFFVNKAFHALSDDKDLLKTVVFKDLSYDCLELGSPFLAPDWKETEHLALCSRYEAFQKTGGFIHRAGNERAQIILAELIMRSTSKLYRSAKTESSFEDDKKSGRNVKAETFVLKNTIGEGEHADNPAFLHISGMIRWMGVLKENILEYLSLEKSVAITQAQLLSVYDSIFSI